VPRREQAHAFFLSVADRVLKQTAMLGKDDGDGAESRLRLRAADKDSGAIVGHILAAREFAFSPIG